MQLNMRALAVLALALLVAPALVAQEAEKPEVVTTDLGGGLYLLAGIGGNVAAHVGERDVLLVDTGYTGLTDSLQEALAAIGDLPVRTVVNTHWHFDHTGGNETLAGDGATIVAHPTVREHQSTAQRFAILDREVEPTPPLARPAVTYDETLTLHRDSATIELIHLANAHTDGDTVVHFLDANVLHTGDIVFYCGYPFIDITHGGTIDGMIAAVEQIIGLCDAQTRVIPGHGQLTDAAGLTTYLEMLRAFRRVVAAEVAAGKDLEAIRSGEATAELDERWGSVYFPPEQFTEMVYRTLPK